jgi:hypothetical protein
LDGVGDVALKLVTAAERSDLIEEMRRLGAAPWPEFLNHDAVVNAHWDLLYELTAAAPLTSARLHQRRAHARFQRPEATGAAGQITLASVGDASARRPGAADDRWSGHETAL